MFLWNAILGQTPLYLWAYNMPMQIVNFPETQHNQVGASGPCPHCGDQSYFQPIATNIDNSEAGVTGIVRCVSATKCQGCKGFLLVIGRRMVHAGNPGWSLESVYPIGTPNDKVAPEVVEAAKGVAEDFSEGLRCQWIRAFKGCVVMCARAIQGSAIALGATKRQLTDQIDELFAKGRITEALKDFAHEVRVTRNLGAHPDKDGLEEVTEQDAQDIVEFTREFLHHVYVMPAKLKARRTPPPTTPTRVP